MRYKGWRNVSVKGGFPPQRARNGPRATDLVAVYPVGYSASNDLGRRAEVRAGFCRWSLMPGDFRSPRSAGEGESRGQPSYGCLLGLFADF